MTIALLGDPEDLALVYVAWLAAGRGLEVITLPESSLGVDWSFELDGNDAAGKIQIGSRALSLSQVSGVFVRLHHDPPLPVGLTLGRSEQMVFVHERREALHHLLDRLDCVVVNRPSAGRANASKPLQMMQLTRAGFDVPEWIVTNEMDAARAFLEAYDGAIYKATSGLRSRVRKADADLERCLVDGTTPTLLQAYVPGRDVRVHTVGNHAFATEVQSAGVDYRFESESRYRAVTIDRALATRCCEMARAEGLLLAGFDFRVTAEDSWRCLEMNPVPSFLPYEMTSGVHIADAVVDLLSQQAVTSGHRPR